MAETKEKVLEVNNLRVSFKTDHGIVKAVRGVSFDLYKGETLCIVGESGSGKSVSSKAIMGILANNSIVEDGKIMYEGENLLEISEEEYVNIRGHKIGMIFQDPLSSLNPIMRIGKQITEATLLNGNKKLKEQELKNIEKLRNNSFDLEKGYLSNNLLDGTLCVVSPECSVFCFEHDSIVDQNLIDLDEITSIYQNTLGNNRKLCFISKDQWNKVSKDFALKFKSGTVDEFYSIKEEPEPVFEELENDDIISSSAMNLFDNSIVEITN